MADQQSWQVRCPICGELSPVFTNVGRLEAWKDQHMTDAHQTGQEQDQ